MQKNSDIDFVNTNIPDLIELYGESVVNDILSDFSCPKNKDVAYFLKNKALTMEKADYRGSRTYLIGFLNDEGGFNLCAYYTLANKPFELNPDLSNSRKKELRGKYSTTPNAVSAVLIGQLSKNFNHGYEYLLSGRDLITLAINSMKPTYDSVGLEIVFLECEDTPKLRRFYEDTGFELYVDKDGKPIRSLHGGNNESELLIYFAKYKTLKVNLPL
ncbi:AhpC/TSA family protein [Tannockella kyphosi]|uniref:AhpC/TSA family protein n=1 Tax=Tannockella kyphosi TaxID=2899121 RepID=UPI00201344AA|nr:AhpC/TSA family protein [Tannockella kyphosi]